MTTLKELEDIGNEHKAAGRAGLVTIAAMLVVTFFLGRRSGSRKFEK